MFPDLAITGERGARSILTSDTLGRFQNIISFRESGSEMHDFVRDHGAPRRLHMPVDDVTRPSLTVALCCYKPPTRADVRRLVTFCEEVEGFIAVLKNLSKGTSF